MKRSKFKINVGFKKVLASFLTITMLGFQANIMAFATSITGVNGNNGVYNINPSSVKGSTGFRHYKNFTLDSGHTANLIFGGINRFVNAVDNQVAINGILNSVNGSGAFANGRAIFVSPKGFVVGSSGVVNVGSLGVYTPSSSAYNSFKNLSVDKMTDALLNGNAYYGNGAITISGMILTREALDLKGSTVNIKNIAKIASGILDKNTNTMLSQDNIAKASSAANARNNATTLFNKLVNSGKANFVSDEFDFANNNGNITIAAKSGGLNMMKNSTVVANGDVNYVKNGKGVTEIASNSYINGSYKIDANNGYLYLDGNTVVNGDVLITRNGDKSVVKEGYLSIYGNLANIKENSETKIINRGDDLARAGNGAIGRYAMEINGNINSAGKTLVENYQQIGYLVLTKNSTLNTKDLAIINANAVNKGIYNGLYIQGKIKSTGDALIANKSGAGGLNIDGYLDLGKATFYNESGILGCGGGSSIITSGKTMFIQKNNDATALIQNVTNNSTEDTIFTLLADNYPEYPDSGAWFSINNIRSNGNVLVENAGDSAIRLYDIDIKGDLSVQNHTYELALKENEQNKYNSEAFSLVRKRKDSMTNPRNATIAIFGDLKANNINIQNADSDVINGIGISSTILGDGVQVNAKVEAVNNVNFTNKSGKMDLSGLEIVGKNVTITNTNTADSMSLNKISAENHALIENAGKGSIILKNELKAKDISIQNQTYSIDTIQKVENNIITLEIVRKNLDAANKDGGLFLQGDVISAGNLYIQNSGILGIETSDNIVLSGANTNITNTNANMNLVNATINGGALTITNSNTADSMSLGKIDVDSDVLIENAGKGNIVINSDITGKNVSLVNQVYDIETVQEANNSKLNIVRKNTSAINSDGGLQVNGNILSNGAFIAENAGHLGIKTSKDIKSLESIYIKNENGIMDFDGKISATNNAELINTSDEAININNTFSAGNTTITHSGANDININGNTITTKDLTIKNTSSGNININSSSVINSNGNVLVQNSTTGKIDIKGALNNSATNGTTKIVNESSNTGGINISGKVGTKNATTITNKGNSLINITGDVVDNVAGVTIEQTNSGTNGGIVIGKNVKTDGDLTVTNVGAKGITLNKTASTISNGKTTIKDTSNVAINAQNGSSIQAGSLLVDKSGKGGINLGGTVNSAGDTLVVNSGTDSINIRNSFTGGKTTIYNDVNGKDINITGALTTNGDTMIVQGGSGILNLSNSLNNNSNGSTIISNVNGSGLNVANIFTNGFTLLENASKGDITINGDINANSGDLSIQNQNYQIKINKTANNNSNLVKLSRVDADSTNKDGGIIANGSLKGNNVYVQNSGNKGIETNGNINASQKLMITTDNAGINLKSGNVTGKNVIISASNKATNGITVNANINSEELMLIENAGKGSIIVDGTLNGNNGKVLIENQTYDITTPRTSFNNDYIVLDVKRVDKPAQNVDGGIFANGTISGGNIFIQNAGNKGITTNLDVISQDDVMITNNNGNINLVSGDISGNNVIVSNSNKAGSLTANANIKATNMALIENAGNGNMTVEGNVEGAIASLQNQTYDIETPRMVAESDGLITLGVKRNNTNSANKGNALVTSGTIKGDTVYVQNSGNGGITSNSDIESTGSVFITNNGGALKLESGTINGKDVTISNSNQASNGILVGANVNTKRNGKLVVENAASGSITINGNLNGNGGYVIIENQTYDITTPRTTFNNDYIVLDVNRINNPSQKVDGGIITNGTIAGGDVFIQNAGLKGISINNDVLSDNLMITNDNGGIDVGNVNLTAQNRNILISNSSNATGGINIAANVRAEKGDVVVESSGNGNIELKDTSSLTGKRVLVENQTYDITTPRVPEGNYILLGVERNKIASPNNNSGIIANGKITAEDIAYIQNSGKKGISGNGNIKGGDVAITNNGGAINLSSGDIDGNKVIISQSNQGEGGVTIGANVKGDDRVLIENAGKGDITIGGNVNGKKVSIQNQTYDIVTPRNADDNPYISLDVTRIDQDSPNKDGGIKITGNVTGTEDNKIQNSGEKGITSSGNIKGGDVAITNNGGAINLSSGDIDGNKVIISQSNQGEGGVTIGANVKGDDRVLIENAGKGDITIGGNVNGKKVSIQNQTYDIVTPRNADDNPYISLDVTRIDQDSPNKDGGIKITGNVTGTEDNKIQNSGDNGITSNGEVKGDDVDITNNGGDVNINGKVDGDDVTISNSDNGGDVNINGKVDGNDVLVENNGSGDINNPQNVNGDVKNHEYGIETPRNTDDDPYISLDVKRNPFPPKPTPVPTPDPTPVIRDNDPTRLIYDKKRDDSFLELKRESIRYGINGDSLSLNSASNHIQSIVDISKTGLAVKTDGSLKINDEVKVNFAYKGIEVEATAKVMRVNQSNNIAGLKFTDLDTLTANKILYLSMLNEAQKEQTASNNQNQQPSFMNVLSKL